jgi:hypothetical protein
MLICVQAALISLFFLWDRNGFSAGTDYHHVSNDENKTCVWNVGKKTSIKNTVTSFVKTTVDTIKGNNETQLQLITAICVHLIYLCPTT